MQGLVLAGRYRLERQLGKGAMGSVWRAEHLALNSAVAVKLIDPGIASTPEGVERFRREARAAAALRSAHVVQVLDYGVEGTQPFLVMELLAGESLSAPLQRAGRLDILRTATIITHVARAMTRAHAENIIHRDLKPDNIFLIEEDGQQIAKVLDFGVAKTSSGFDALATQTGFVLGTPCYMSPEQMEGRGKVDHRSDLWALGVISCECVTGRRPFEGATLAELMLNICARRAPVPSSFAAVPDGFDAWFLKAVHREPALRFQSAKELAEALQAIASKPASSDTAPPTRAPAASVVDAFAPTRAAAPAERAAPRRMVTGTHAAVVPTVPGGPFAGLESVSPHAVTESRLAAGAGGGARVHSRRTWLAVAGVVVAAAIFGGVARFGGERGTESAPAAEESKSGPPPAGAMGGDPAPPVRQRKPAPPRAAPSAGGTGPGLDPRSRGPGAVPRTDPEPEPEPVAPAAAKTPATASPVRSSELRCQRDPFTGVLRRATARAAAADVIPCEQDPFTGEYRRR